MKGKRLTAPFTLALILIAYFSWSQVSQERTVGSFTRLENRSSIQIELYQGTTSRLIVQANESVLEQIETWIDGDVLYIDVVGPLRYSGDPKIILTVTDLENIRINGSGDIVTQTPLKAEILNLELNGSGNADLEVITEQLTAKLNGSGDMTITGDPESVTVMVHGSGSFDLAGRTMRECIVKLTGSGDVTLKGETGILKIKQTSSGDVNAGNMVSASCSIEKSGSGDTSVHVNGELTVVSSGSGDVYYRGQTILRSTEVTGSGEVRKID